MERVGEVEVLVEKALRGIGVGIDDEGGAVNPFGAWRFGRHFRGIYRRVLGDQERGREKQKNGNNAGGHRLGESV